MFNAVTTATIAFLNASFIGNNPLHMSSFCASSWLFNILACDSVVQNLFAASSSKAFTFDISSAATLNVSDKRSQAFANDRNAFLVLTLLQSNSSIVHTATSHCSHSQFTKDSKAAQASCSRNVLNSSTDNQAVSANQLKAVPQDTTASFMSNNALLTAVPHASAFIPTELNAVDIAAMSSGVTHATFPADANLFVNSTIWLSVVANPFPSSTTTLARSHTFSIGICSMFAILAKDVAAASSVKSVVTAIFAMVSVKSKMSHLATPN